MMAIKQTLITRVKMIIPLQTRGDRASLYFYVLFQIHPGLDEQKTRRFGDIIFLRTISVASSFR
jgi:hypothetical protein